MQKRIIKLFGEVNEKMVSYVVDEVFKILEENEKSKDAPLKDVIIFINSFGGDYRHTATILDLLCLLENKKIGVVISNSCDATNPIFLSCHVRYATTNSQFIFGRFIKKYKNYLTNTNLNVDFVINWLKDSSKDYCISGNLIFNSEIAHKSLTYYKELLE